MKKNTTQSEETRYMIVAHCDPYNAKFHYHHSRVLRRNGATPVEWVHNDNYGYGFTKEEALGQFEYYAAGKPTWFYEDDESVAEFTRETGKPYDGYEGEGWYREGQLMYKKGDMGLYDDVMSYLIEELIPE